MGLSFLSGTLSVLPHRLAVHTGDALGRVAHRLVPMRKSVAEENLKQAFPEWSERERRRIVSGVYRHFGRTLAEFCRLPVLNPKALVRRVRISGEDNLRRAAEAGRGVLIVSGHIGNWELAAAALASRGHPLTLLVGPQRNKLAQEMFNRYREMSGGQVLVTKGGDVKGVFRQLKAGRMVTTLADQDAGKNGVFVDFFGRPVSAAPGLFRIARKTGAPIVFAIDTRHGLDHHLELGPPIISDPSTDPEEEAIAWTRRYHQRLEEVIREHPEQWLWLHRRWRTRPPDERPAD